MEKYSIDFTIENLSKEKYDSIMDSLKELGAKIKINQPLPEQESKITDDDFDKWLIDNIGI